MLLLREDIEVDKSFLPDFPSSLAELGTSVSTVTDFSDIYLKEIEKRGPERILDVETANLESIMVRVVRFMANAEEFIKNLPDTDETKVNTKAWLNYFEAIKKRICLILGKGDEDAGLQNLFKSVLAKVIAPSLSENEKAILNAMPLTIAAYDAAYFDELRKVLTKLEAEKTRSLRDESITALLEHSVASLISLKGVHRAVEGAAENINASLVLLYKLLARN
jgi:hypothetical protein